MLGSRYSLNNNNPLVYRKKAVDAVTDFVDDVVDVIEDTYDAAEQAVSDIYTESGLESVFDEINDFRHEVNQIFFEGLDDLTGNNGLFGWAIDLNEGSRATWDAAIQGDLRAIIYIAMTGYTLSLGASTIASTSFLSFYDAAIILSNYASVYTTALNLMLAGQMSLSTYYGIVNKLNDVLNASMLALTNMYINGSIWLWMPGGILYDAPKAGDVKFNIDGNLNAEKFLDRRDNNQTMWLDWQENRYHDFSSKVMFTNMPGDLFFSVNKLA